MAAADNDDMPDLLPPTWSGPATNVASVYQQQQAAPYQQQAQQQQAQQAALPFPTLLASGPPSAWTGGFAAVGPAPSPPRTAAHVPVPASLAFDLVQQTQQQHSHSHDGVPCGHSHVAAPTSAAASPAQYQHVPAPVAAVSYSDHGHSHGGAACTGHDAPAAPPRKLLSPISYEEPARPRGSYLRRAVAWLHLAWRGGGSSRNVLLYILLKSCFMSMQFGWGLYSGNLNLVSASFHTGFDVLALVCAIVAMLNAKYPPRHPYSYGLDRQEVVAAFTNAIFLLFVATFMVIETFHTAYFPPEVERDDIALAVLGFCMDLLGLALFHRFIILQPAPEVIEASATWSSSPSSSSTSASSATLGGNSGRGHLENMHGVSLHVVADLVGHSSLLAAVWLHQLYPQASWVFALSFLLSALLIIQLVVPLFQTTGAILLMTTPVGIRLGLDRCIREISFYDGVLELRSAHWWTHSPGVIVGSLHIRIRSDASEQAILTYVHQVLKKYVTRLTVQVEKDVPVPFNENWIPTHQHTNGHA